MSSSNERTPSPLLVNIFTVVLWIVIVGALPLGIALIHWGLEGLHRDQPYCYGTAMSREDTCQINEYRNHRTNDYEGQLDYEHHGAKVQIVFGAALSGIGVLLLLGVVAGRLKKKPQYNFDELLVTPTQAAALLGVSSMELEGSQDSLYDDSACLVQGQDYVAVFAPAQRALYGKRLVIDTRIRTLTENADDNPGRSPAHVIEAVIEFASAKSAARAQRDHAQLWSEAAGRSVTYRHGEQQVAWQFSPLGTTGQTLTIRRAEQQSTTGWAGQRALAARGNIVIDVQVSGYWSGTEQATQLLEAIAAKIPAGK